MKTTTPPKGRNYIDYDLLKSQYNLAPLNHSVVLDRVYNITTFAQRLENRGLRKGYDFQVNNVGKNCYVTRLSNAEMS